jgi:hypothetical protein
MGGGGGGGRERRGGGVITGPQSKGIWRVQKNKPQSIQICSNTVL